jgi:tetratricopeptide (TPR) repeat protein/transcriptional regulator with XRE-family HTH domain
VAEPSRGTFAQALRRLRKARLMTHQTLAEASGVQVRTISDLERGVTLSPRPSTVRMLADALGLTGAERHGFEAAAQSDDQARTARAARGTTAPADRETSVPAASGTSGQATVPAAGTTTARGTTEPAGGSAATRTLPRDIASYTGREVELRWLVNAADSVAGTGGVVGIYVIEGMAGVGKTSLALRAAHEIAGRFPDGQLFLDLHGYTPGLQPMSSDEALRSLLRAVGTPNVLIPRKLEERAAFYRSRLADTRTLIVLDNVSSLSQVEHLLPGSGGCLVIITSRRNLDGLDDAQVLPLGVPSRREAIALFRTVAGPDRVAADDQDVAQIVELCGRLPLAVRITAARLARRRALLIGDVLAELRDEHDRLTHFQNEQRDVTAAFGLSLKNLPDPEQRMFRRLGLVPGPDFDAYAAASLADTSPETARRRLESLLDHNLLLQRVSGRYRFHDLIRVYARTLASHGPVPRAPAAGAGLPVRGLAPSQATEPLDRLLDFYLTAAQAADQHIERRLPRVDQPAAVSGARRIPPLDTQEKAHTWMANERANLDAAIHFAAANRRAAYATGLSAACAQYLRVYGPWSRAMYQYRVALAAATAVGDLAGQAAVLCFTGVLQRQFGTLRDAEESLGQALNHYRELGNGHGQAGVLAELGIAWRLTGEPAQATGTLNEALNLYRSLGDRLGQAGVLAELGAVYRQTGAFDVAKNSLTEALDLYRSLGNRYGEAATLAYLGGVQWKTSDLGPAEESLNGALKINRELADPIGQANNLLYLGGVHRDAGALEQAQECFTGALDIYTRLGDRRSQAGALSYLGTIQLRTGEYALAGQSLPQALALFRELHDPGGEAETLNYVAALAHEMGDYETALGHFTEALLLARKISSARDEADALDGIAGTYLTQGEIGRASTNYQQALNLYREMGCHADADRIQRALNGLGQD